MRDIASSLHWPNGSLNEYSGTANRGGAGLMINEIDIRHFKCFQALRIEGCRRVNIIVGDNGSGKTALLEAIFMAIGTSTEIVTRYRQQRGLDGGFRGSPRKITDALLGDFFYNLDTKVPISIALFGDGPEARSLTITRGSGEALLPLEGGMPASVQSAIQFTWTDSKGVERKANPEISLSTFKLPDTGEDLPNFFYFAANQVYSSLENAERFSGLSRAKRQRRFIEVFKKEYPWIEDMGIEIVAGSTGIYGTLAHLDDKIPIGAISGGINRIVTVLLAAASSQNAVLLVDELENGLYYKHYLTYWEAILSFAREYKSQLFITTHSAEWLKALVEAAGDDTADIAVWRLERGEDGKPILLQFDGAMIKDAIEHGAEARGR
ncbi:ATP/GTP phosphatase [soil metagenome]